MSSILTKPLLCLCSLLLIIAGCSETPSPEISGTPFAGDITMRGAAIWFQMEESLTELPEIVVLDSTEQPIASFEAFELGVSGNYRCQLHSLKPGSNYSYFLQFRNESISDTLQINTQPLWQYRTDPPTVRIALGSCAYINEAEYDRPGKPYGGDYEIFTTIANDKFDAMVWLGDNVYLREADFGSFDGYTHRYNHTRGTLELQALMAKGAHYAIWDDHDFGPNDCDGSYVRKEWAKKAFDAFWVNPAGGVGGAPELNTTAFQYGDVDFFLLDNRSHRVNHWMGEEGRQMLGKVQIEWLLNNLKNSQAPFKFVAVGSQMISNAAIYENFAQFPEERSWLIEELNKLDIKGVVFLTGDRHNSELSKLQLANGNWVYDLTVSPLTSGSYDHSEEPNFLREQGTMVGDRNYGILEISGARKQRVLRMQVKSTSGDIKWERIIDTENNYELQP
ncbi:MAG: phosphodiesterase [Crocinitomicaceae bacterium]|nr:phosphodiesterase [Crocinitomicaceae bacterium]